MDSGMSKKYRNVKVRKITFTLSLSKILFRLECVKRSDSTDVDENIICPESLNDHSIFKGKYIKLQSKLAYFW